MNTLLNRRFGGNIHQRAFTLVEVLVVMVILATMGGMVVAAVRGVTTAARESRTKSIIASINSVIQEQYESYKYRPLSVEIPTLFSDVDTTIGTGPTPNIVVGLEVLADESARVRLNMIRDLQRMELPDRLTDILDDPSAIYAAATRVVADGVTGEIRRQAPGADRRRTFRVAWYGYSGAATTADDVPSKLAAYRDRLPATATVENQGAECLYLIMSNSFVAGTPAISAIPNANIGDLDGDNALEILDGWGRPLGFVRWPIGFSDPEQSIVTNAAVDGVPDDFDLFRSDFAYVDGTSTAVATASVVGAVDVNLQLHNRRPWSMRPLIVSSGDDGLPGITFDPIGSLDAGPTFTHINSRWNWPIDPANMGIEAPGRSGVYPMVDPYLRRFIAINDPMELDRSMTSRRLPGEFLSATDTTEAADNITNFDLDVE